MLVPQFEGWFQPHLGGGTSTLCKFGADTHKPAFLFLGNSTKTLPEIINSSPKSLYQPLEAFRVRLNGSNHSPHRYPQACGKDYQQWLSPLFHPARKGPFTALGTCSPGEPQAKGCTCITPGPNPGHHPNKHSPVILRNASKLLFSTPGADRSFQSTALQARGEQSGFEFPVLTPKSQGGSEPCVSRPAPRVLLPVPGPRPRAGSGPGDSDDRSGQEL